MEAVSSAFQQQIHPSKRIRRSLGKVSYHFPTNPHYIRQEPPSNIRRKSETELTIQNCIRKEAQTLTRKHNGHLYVLVNEGLTQVATAQKSRVTDLHGDCRT